MSDGTLIAASAMVGLQRQLELTTRNLANLRTPGFQPRVAASASAFETALDEAAPHLVNTDETISFEPGTIVPDVGNPLAVAIDGPGFFEVETPRGTAYTRNGDFTLDSEGVLVTRAGYVVQGDGGPIRTTPGAGEIAIDETGAVRQGDVEVGRLRVWRFSDPHGLRPVSDTLYEAPRGFAPTSATETRLRPQALEFASETSVASLVEMIKVHRQYDAAQRVLQSIAETYQQRIRSMG